MVILPSAGCCILVLPDGAMLESDRRETTGCSLPYKVQLLLKAESIGYSAFKERTLCLDDKVCPATNT